MRKSTTLVTAFCFLLAMCFPAYAEEPPPCEEPQAVTSPCKGVLLPAAAAAKGLSCLKIDVPKLELEILKMQELHVLRITSLNLIIDAETNRATRIESLLERSLSVSKGPAWYEHPVFWAVFGVVIGAGATIGIAYAINPATK